MDVDGPYYKQEIITYFGLDSVPFKIHSKNLYIAKLQNNSKSVVAIECSSQSQIFPDSSWYHSYTPFSAQNRSWTQSVHYKPQNGLHSIEILPRESRVFWFSNYYDEYIDSMTIHFTLLKNKEKNTVNCFQS